MSLSYSGLNTKTKAIPVTISVSSEHPLIRMAQIIPWGDLAELVIPDLKKTTKKGFFNRGRKLNLRIHLGAYLLQTEKNKTDRSTEWEGKDNAAYSLFCGYGVVEEEEWRIPDHTSIQDFRSRLSPETVKNIANILAKYGVDLGYGDPSKMDQDSTIQEANMAYPSDVSLMSKFAEKVKKVWDWAMGKGKNLSNLEKEIDLKKIKEKAREYFFSKKKKEEKKVIFADLYKMVLSNITEPVNHLKALSGEVLESMPWNIKNAYRQILNHFENYFKSVLYFIDNGKIDPKKILSLYLEKVSCFNKGKQGKKLEFGRSFQIGKIGGNFAIVAESTDIRMEDKQSVKSLIAEHQRIFGKGVLKSYGTDKGYYTKKNQKYLWNLEGLEESALQKPGITFNGCLFKEEESNYQRLVDRRSGIEPIIGHIKHGGQLGKSRMKSDQSTLAAGYAAVAGHNLRCLIRHLKGKKIKPM